MHQDRDEKLNSNQVGVLLRLWRALRRCWCQSMTRVTAGVSRLFGLETTAEDEFAADSAAAAGAVVGVGWIGLAVTCMAKSK